MARAENYERLAELIRPFGKALVAFSGGVDSSLLLRVAADVLGPGNVEAFIASSPIHPAEEVRDALSFARSLGVGVTVDHGSPLADSRFAANDRDRCYFCKSGMLAATRRRAREIGFRYVLEGSNADDGRDFRPGSRAVAEQGVASPLKEAGLSKPEIRALAKELGLPTHDKPSDACLATRIPYGTPVTEELLARIGAAERFLRQEAGLRRVRVRAHGATARIEVDPEEIADILERRLEIAEGLKRKGFIYVAVDLEGYRTGSMNE